MAYIDKERTCPEHRLQLQRQLQLRNELSYNQTAHSLVTGTPRERQPPARHGHSSAHAQQPLAALATLATLATHLPNPLTHTHKHTLIISSVLNNSINA